MLINITNQQSALKIDSQQIKRVAKHVILEENQSCEEVYIYFVDTETICQLHEEFFQDPSSTDCISFPIDEEGTPYRVLGEVFICPATAVAYAIQHQVNSHEELILYLIHGLLHLMGYDDLDEEDQRRMRQAESRHLQSLKTLKLIQ